MHPRAAIERFFAPGYSTCFRCRRPWKFVEPHITDYTPGQGCFPLCESCWTALATPEARLPFYRRLHAIWGRSRTTDRWEDIRRAVMGGK
jgi:hypothetical protein